MFDSNVSDSAATDPALIYVTTAEEFQQALASARGGETILLAGGDYGSLSIRSRDFDETLTIRSADPNDAASFSRMLIRDASNVTIEGLDFDYTYSAGDWLGTRRFDVEQSSDITLRDATFIGDNASGTGTIDDGYGYGKALGIKGSSNILVENSEVSGFWKGIGISDSTDVVLRGNNLHDLRSDGINLVQVSNVTIEGNHIHDFRSAPGSSDHPDMIQMWTGGTDRGSSDVTIRNNLLDVGEGDWTQSIFLTHQTSDVPAALRYSNITIEENVIINEHTHGITVGEVDGLLIRNNTLLRADGATGTTDPRINLTPGSTDVVVSHNAVSKITGESFDDTWDTSGNVLIQDTNPDAPGYYGNIFFNALTDNTNALSNIRLLPDGTLAREGAGATWLTYDETPDTLTAIVRAGQGDFLNDVTFDGSFSAGPGGRAAETGATFTWDFGDGTVATGAKVAHRYTEPGVYVAELTVEMPDGSKSQIRTQTDVTGASVLSFGADDGAAAMAGIADSGTVRSGPFDLTGGKLLIGDDALHSIGRGQITDIFGAGSFSIETDLKVDGGGELLRLHTSFRVDVTAGGELRMSLWNEAGASVTVQTTGADLIDGATHSVTFDYDGSRLAIIVDDAVLGEKDFSGDLGPMQYWGLTFGRSEGRGATAELSTFDLQVEPDRWNFEPAPKTGDGDGAAGPELHEMDVFDFAYRAEFTAEGISDRQLKNGAELVADGEDGRVELAQGSYVKLGRLQDFEDAGQLAVELDFNRLEADGSTGRLLWNHTRLGVELKGDSLEFLVGTADGGVERVLIRDLGLNDTESHNLRLYIDTEQDVLRGVLDGQEIVRLGNVDFDMGSSADYQWGWTVGSPWGAAAAGVQVSDLQIGGIDARTQDDAAQTSSWNDLMNG